VSPRPLTRSGKRTLAPVTFRHGSNSTSKPAFGRLRRLQDMGIRLKGDIPILMNGNSADVWSAPRYFDLSLRAGAPPDMYSAEGQNWMFPVYDWDALSKDGYGW